MIGQGRGNRTVINSRLMDDKLRVALSDPIWVNHRLADTYLLNGSDGVWLIAYYPIFECGKTGKSYNEPRALIESPIIGGIDFREVPLRYLRKNH